MIKQWLLNAGCDRIFLVNNVTREGIDELMEYLAEDPVKNYHGTGKIQTASGAE